MAQKGDCYDKDGHLLYAVGTGNILRIPAADVVEVVRCRECKYWEHRPDRQYDLCAYLFGAKRSCNPEDFCSRGERKGGQEEIPAGPYDLLYEEGGPDA